MVGAADGRRPPDPSLIRQVAGRVREAAAGYEPPDFGEAPSADAALFLCAIDHRTGYRRAHGVDGEGPFEGSELLWALGCAAERRRPTTLSAGSLAAVDAEGMEELFRSGDETLTGATERARLWRDLAQGLEQRYDGSASELLVGADSRLGGPGGLIARLGEFEAYSDPLAKKAYLFAKIAARRGWFAPVDPGAWEVCADNVLMRLALRAGLVQPGPAEVVRSETREALKLVAADAGLAPPLLDDLLWELGKRDPDLLGTAGGRELREPPRPEGTVWY
ncbi:MAG: hypothetical protein ACRDKV_09930 [Solirubrobacterales bacterium]